MRRWLQGLLNSLSYAAEGITYALVTQRNMQVHFGIAFLVMIFCLILDVSRLEIILVFFAIILVISAELLNTAIESIVDMVTERYHHLAKIAKDTAAASVLLVAIQAVIVGLLVFYDKIWPIRWRSMTGFSLEWYFAAIVPLILLYFMIRAMFVKIRGGNREKARN